MLSRTQAIRNFLKQCESPRDLVELYTPEMECHVNVQKMQNTPVKNQEYKGHKYSAYRDIEDGTLYKPFRIPYESMKESAYYDDPPMTFDLKKYAEGIGMTGWNFVTKQSMWLGYDFDSMVNHEKGLLPEELEAIKKAVYDLDYVTIRKSTTGSGFHIYVFLDPVDTKTHTEHQCLARAVLSKMSLDCGYELKSKVDQLGGILWIWALKMEGTDGLQLVKQGNILKDIPLNWKAHEGVINKKSFKIRPDLIKEEELEDFNNLAKQRMKVPLDEKHRKVIEELAKETEYETSWNSDYGMLITHTVALANVHKRLSLIGPFTTGSSSSSVKNCFAFPLGEGAWTVRRHGRGVTESSTWMEDLGGWTFCYYNRVPDFKTACLINGGIEDTDGGYAFKDASMGSEAARQMGVDLKLPDNMKSREMKLKIHAKSKKLLAEVTMESQDPSIQGWIKKTKQHQFLSPHQIKDEGSEEEVSGSEELRHCVSEDGVDAGWYVLGIDEQWVREPRPNILSVLSSMGYTFREREAELGRLVVNYWRLVNEPFQPEYLGGRSWNRNAAKMKYTKKDAGEPLKYDHWNMILDHLGKGLDDAVENSEWCSKNDIMNGASYLKCWIAALFQYPKEPLPYLFFYGGEDSGKSMFHEAISLLMTKGVCRIDSALKNQNDFNGEIASCVLGVIEETDLSSKKTGPIINKIKDWVTSRELSIHFKGETPYMARNTMHMVHCSNSGDAVPVFPGDTRVVVTHVGPIKKIIPKSDLIELLEQEAQDFTTELLNLEIPKSPSRLRIPIVETSEKAAIADSNMTDIDRFIKENIYLRSGYALSLSDVWDQFCDHYSPDSITKNKFNKVFQSSVGCLKGRYGSGAQWHWGNVSFIDSPSELPALILEGDHLK